MNLESVQNELRWMRIQREARDKCRFRFLCQQGRGGNRRAIYVCVSAHHHFPTHCLPHATAAFKVHKP